MSLMCGTKLGPYEIQSPLGAGGMGEVYKARDTRLERTVAIKILPSHLSGSVDLKQRFEREAKAISSLQDPHICTLFDVGSQNGTDFLVMEYLEGQTLADRLTKGALPLEQAFKIGIEIAGALDKAHRVGIVHRDLKPSNIMLTRMGAKLMDFGLAKPAGVAAAAGVASSAPLLSAAMTISGPSPQISPLTTQGTIVGTIQYMSPEQLEGKEADARSDIFALGAVLYEMITGRRAFEGKSQLSVATAILEKEPETLRSLQPSVPEALDQVIESCLSKDPENRFASAHDIRLQLQRIAVTKPGKAANEPAGVRVRELILVAALMGLILAAGWFAYSRWKPLDTPRQFVTSILELPAAAEPDRASGMQTSNPGAFALSPDGRYLAFVGGMEGMSKLWIRSMDGKTDYAISGSEGANAPFWSPDGNSVGFFSQAAVKKVTVSTGLVTTICPARSRSGAWGAKDWIIFAGGPGAPMYKVSAQGGTPIPLPETVNGFRASFFPDGRHFLYSEWTNGGSDYRVKGADIEGGKTVDLGIQTSIRAIYASGYLVYSKTNDLVAQRFDANRLRLLSEPDVIVHGNRQSFADAASFTVSQTGILIYRGTTGNDAYQVQVFSRIGALEPSQIPPGLTNNPKFSPDGNRIIYDLETADSRDLWIFDLVRHLNTRFTFGNGSFSDPLWSPDGRRVAMTVESKQGSHILIQDTEDANTRALPDVPGMIWPRSWSPDGNILFTDFWDRAPGGNIRRSIETVSLQDGKTTPLFADNSFVRRNATISPDSHWLAYVSDESGREEVYVQAFPAPTARVQISNAGGTQPRWGSGGREIYYISSSDMITSVNLSYPNGLIHPGASRQLFKVNPLYPGGNPFDVSPDGKLFVVNTVNSDQTLPPVHLIMNWDIAVKK